MDVIITPETEEMIREIVETLHLKTNSDAVRVACSRLLESIRKPSWCREYGEGPDTFQLGSDGKLHPVEERGIGK